MKKDNVCISHFSIEEAPGTMILGFNAQTEYKPGALVEIVNELFSILSASGNTAEAVVLRPPPGILAPEKFKSVLAAHGAICFSSVENPADRLTRRTMEADFVRDINASHRLIKDIRHIEEFVVAAMSGSCVLSMFGPALACDLRVASEDFVLVNRTPYSRFMPWSGLPWFLARIMGRQKAWALISEEKDIDAGQALELGLVDRIVPAGQLKAASIALAQEGASRPWAIRVALKQAMLALEAPLDQYLEMEKSAFLSSVERRAASFMDGQ